MRTALVSAVLASLSLAFSIPDATAQSSSDGMKGLLGSLWGRLRAATPRSSTSTTTTTVTAGLRGSEATESELKPYWRGDRETDAAERKALEGAQALADSGKFADAAKAFDAFVQTYPRSPLAINAVFGSAVANAALGDRAKARAGFQDFLKRDPQHPLAKDAEQAIAALK